ncbi:PIN domain-containing protein [Rhodoferax sp.]|uniref:PIN domain-containing protein n=1 Tax=Rhodoferax sp. TaxID=50421 RepID=UPI002851C45A|nr:PIN domain-containing protein [Rhodoferax sp.]MDR3370538.1 PIN domain-containing protein [Rhodoferax sp.]
MKYLLDTNIVNYFLRDASSTLSQRILDSTPDTLAISIISAGELRYGLSKLPSSKRTTELGHRLNAVFTAIAVQPLPADAAQHYGNTRTQLEAAGTLIDGNDLWIAAHSLAHNMTLVTNNTRKFERVAGLRVENWL